MSYLQHNLSGATVHWKVYTFKREEGAWHIYLPALPEQGFSREDLGLTEGAHKLLNCLSKGAGKMRLWLSDEPVDNADVLELVEHCEAPVGGAIYRYTPFQNHSHRKRYWICDFALLIFGDLPQRIYLQRLPLKSKEPG
jgi:hypothetical protein